MKKLYFLMIALLCTAAAFGQANFTKITDAVFTQKSGDWRSVNWIDYDNDGWVDIFITQGPKAGANNALYKNNQNGTFTEVTRQPIVLDKSPSDGATWGDVDNDGDLDCFVANWYGVNNLFYLNNGDGNFTEITSGNLVTDGGFSETAAWGDYDNDGFLDLYVTNSDGTRRNFLYHNERNGTFSKITSGAPATDAFISRMVNWVDYDNDGDLDLFVTNEEEQNENLYKNMGGGVFDKITNLPIVTDFGNTMSSSWGDMDNDGDLDLFMANDRTGNSLFRHDGKGGFSKVSSTVSETGNSFSSQWGDVDNDGDLDLFVTNAFGGGMWKNFIYLNDGTGRFEKVTTGAITDDLGWNYGCAMGDYDNDGDLDIATAGCFNARDNNRLYRNETKSKNWLQIKLTGVATNKSAIGCKVRIKANIKGKSVWQMREISSHSGQCGQNQLTAHFGLDEAIVVDSLVVAWLSGQTDRFSNIMPNRLYQIIEGGTLTTGLKEIDASSVVNGFSVSPNPVTDIVQVNFRVEKSTDVSLDIYDMSGRLVRTMLTKKLSKGNHQFDFNKTQTAVDNGIYQLVLKAGGQTLAKKVVFVR